MTSPDMRAPGSGGVPPAVTAPPHEPAQQTPLGGGILDQPTAKSQPDALYDGRMLPKHVGDIGTPRSVNLAEGSIVPRKTTPPPGEHQSDRGAMGRPIGDTTTEEGTPYVPAGGKVIYDRPSAPTTEPSPKAQAPDPADTPREQIQLVDLRKPVVPPGDDEVVTGELMDSEPATPTRTEPPALPVLDTTAEEVIASPTAIPDDPPSTKPVQPQEQVTSATRTEQSAPSNKSTAPMPPPDISQDKKPEPPPATSTAHPGAAKIIDGEYVTIPPELAEDLPVTKTTSVEQPVAPHTPDTRPLPVPQGEPMGDQVIFVVDPDRAGVFTKTTDGGVLGYILDASPKPEPPQMVDAPIKEVIFGGEVVRTPDSLRDPGQGVVSRHALELHNPKNPIVLYEELLRRWHRLRASYGSGFRNPLPTMAKVTSAIIRFVTEQRRPHQ